MLLTGVSPNLINVPVEMKYPAAGDVDMQVGVRLWLAGYIRRSWQIRFRRNVAAALIIQASVVYCDVIVS